MAKNKVKLAGLTLISNLFTFKTCKQPKVNTLETEFFLLYQPKNVLNDRDIRTAPLKVKSRGSKNARFFIRFFPCFVSSSRLITFIFVANLVTNT